MANVPNLTLVRDPAKAKKLGRYELEECLGAEGGRETYRARVRGLAGFDRLFAVKCLRRHGGPITSRADPFLVAAKRVGSVIDARVARVLDADIIDGTAVVVTELIPGLDLDRFREWAQSSGELASGSEPAAEKWQRLVAYIGNEIARALASMHALVPPFVHGGLSPRNVILTARGGLKVVDAGLAVAAAKGGDAGSQRAAAYGAAGPGGEVLPSSDVRALGAILFELAVGELPPAEATAEASRQVLATAWPAMAELLASMLAEDPKSRPRARQVAETLAKQWSSVPETTITAGLAALVHNFSAFVADGSPPGGVAAPPAPEAPALEPPSTSGVLPIAPPSAAAIASGSFFAVSDAPTRVSPDGGYASAIFRALPPEAAASASAPSKAVPARSHTAARMPAAEPVPASKPGPLGSGMPALPPAPKISSPPAPQPAPAPPAPKLAPAPPPPAPKPAPFTPATPPSSARTVIWSPAPAQALGIAPALLARTMTGPPRPAAMPVLPVGSMASPALAAAAVPDEADLPETMAETADWGAQALAALGSQAGVPTLLADAAEPASYDDTAEPASYDELEGEAPPPVSDPTIEEAFALASPQPTTGSWAASQPASQAGPPALPAQGFSSPAASAFAVPGAREMLEDELVEDETAPMLLSPSGEPQAPLEDTASGAGEPTELAALPSSASSGPLEATAFMSDEETAAPAEEEPERLAEAMPAPAPALRPPSTRNALKPKADLAADELGDEPWEPTRSRSKRIAVVLIAAAAIGAGAAAVTIGLGGKKTARPVSAAKAKAPKTAPAAPAVPPETAPAPAAVAKTTPTGKTPALEKKSGLVAKATPAPAERKAPPAVVAKAEAPASGKKGAAAAPSKPAGGANAELALIPRLAEAAPPPSSGASGMVRVRIESKPAGARVWINGQERGDTPLSVQLRPGTARVVLVRAGHLTKQTTLEVREGASVEETLKPVEPPMTGEARFRAECQTAGKLPIVVDGKETGIFCPFSKMRVDPGVHNIGLLIPATGQVHQKEVTLHPGVRSIVFGD